MDRAGLITLEQARAAGLSFDEPEPRACPHCGAALDPLGAALAGRVAWVSVDWQHLFGRFREGQPRFPELDRRHVAQRRVDPEVVVPVHVVRELGP